MTTPLGARIFEELKARKLHSQFVFADLQELKAAAGPEEVRALLERKGCACTPERQSVLHFADAVELHLLRRSLEKAKASCILFGTF